MTIKNDIEKIAVQSKLPIDKIGYLVECFLDATMYGYLDPKNQKIIDALYAIKNEQDYYNVLTQLREATKLEYKEC